MTDESSSLEAMDQENSQNGNTQETSSNADNKASTPANNPFAKKGKILNESPLADRDLDLNTGALEAELAAAKAEASENHDRYLRALAELENFKKRALKERSELLKYQGERIFVELLDIVDDLDRALQFKQSDPASLVAGFEMIFGRFNDLLSKWEIRGDSQIGKNFDPMIHNAIAKVPSNDQAQGVIVNELKKPFFYKDKLLRPGEVIVSDGPAKTEE